MKILKEVYIVLSRTNTFLSRTISFFTRDEFTHASISFDPSLNVMYSFGRKNPYNPFIGGFVEESKNFGTFKRFDNSLIKIIKINIKAEQYRKIQQLIDEMKIHADRYRYNYEGLLLAAISKNLENSHAFYCSEFVKMILEEAGVFQKGMLPNVVHPNDFLSYFREEIYTGRLRDYAA